MGWGQPPRMLAPAPGGHAGDRWKFADLSQAALAGAPVHFVPPAFCPALSGSPPIRHVHGDAPPPNPTTTSDTGGLGVGGLPPPQNVATDCPLPKEERCLHAAPELVPLLIGSASGGPAALRRAKPIGFLN